MLFGDASSPTQTPNLSDEPGSHSRESIFSAEENGTFNWVGIQCKVRNNGDLSESDVRSDVQRAKKFNPRLSELIIATTAPRDAKIQAVAWQLTDENLRADGFAVTICSWDDILEELSRESNFDICHSFYANFFINYERLGIAISRVLRVEIGVGVNSDTQYELLIGKTAPADSPASFSGLDYWKGHNFIANWNDKTLDTFSHPVFASDLTNVFKFSRDAHIIAVWLNGLRSIDDLIYGDLEQHTMLISEDEYKEFQRSVRE